MSKSEVKVKKGDVVEVLYEGYIANNNELFDTNIKEVAEKHGKDNEGVSYEPITVVIGKSMVIKGLDKALEGKELNKEYEIEIPPEDGFGKYNPKKIRTYPTDVFIKQKINPYPGMIITFENNQQAKILSVSGGRVKVDFNHPLAGKRLYYKFKIIRKVEDPKEKFLGVFRNLVGMKISNDEVEYDNTTKIIRMNKKYEGLSNFIKEFINEFFKDEIKDVEFVEKEEKPKEEGKINTTEKNNNKDKE